MSNKCIARLRFRNTVSLQGEGATEIVDAINNNVQPLVYCTGPNRYADGFVTKYMALEEFLVTKQGHFLPSFIRRLEEEGNTLPPFLLETKRSYEEEQKRRFGNREVPYTYTPDWDGITLYFRPGDLPCSTHRISFDADGVDAEGFKYLTDVFPRLKITLHYQKEGLAPNGKPWQPGYFQIVNELIVHSERKLIFFNNPVYGSEKELSQLLLIHERFWNCD